MRAKFGRDPTAVSKKYLLNVYVETCYYNSIVGQMYIDSVPVLSYPLTDVVCYRPSSESSTQLEVQAHVDDRVLSCHLAGL